MDRRAMTGGAWAMLSSSEPRTVTIGDERMIEIIVPFPDSSLFPNRRQGQPWQSTHAAKVKAHEDGRMAATAATFGHDSLPPRNVDVTIVFTPPDRRRRDVDGMLSALKPTLDGIAEALGVDDSSFNPIHLHRGEPMNGGKVTIIIDDLPF